MQREKNLALENVADFRSVTAGGVAGTVAGRTVLVGKPGFLRSEKITGFEQLETTASASQREGKSVIFVAVDGKPAGLFILADPIKATTPDAIDEA